MASECASTFEMERGSYVARGAALAMHQHPYTFDGGRMERGAQACGEGGAERSRCEAICGVVH